MGVHVLHGIDATRLDDQREKLFTQQITNGSFDRVVFNFPHVGGGSVKEDLIANQHMLTKFFACAGKFLSGTGEIHVTLRATSFYDSWEINTLAEKTGLRSLDTVDFDQNAFHGYQQVRTRGSTCMREAPTTSGAKTYRFTCAAAKVETQKTDTTAPAASRKKALEITSGSITRTQDGGRQQPGDHVRDGSSDGSDSSEGSAESSECASFTAEEGVASRKMELPSHFKAERARADTHTKVPDASTQEEIKQAELVAAQRRKRRLLMELRSEREHSSDTESSQRKRARTPSLSNNPNQSSRQSNMTKKQVGGPGDDPLAAMLLQWKQSTTYA